MQTAAAVVAGRGALAWGIYPQLPQVPGAVQALHVETSLGPAERLDDQRHVHPEQPVQHHVLGRGRGDRQKKKSSRIE